MSDRPPSPQTERLRQLLDAADPWLMALALAAVVAHLVELMVGSSFALNALLAVVDLLFVGDLLLKLAVLGRPYRRSPWFVVDLLSSLPALDFLPGFGPALRLVRALRTLRLIRLMRLVRMVRVLRVLQSGPDAARAQPESLSDRTRRLVTSFVLVYAGMVMLVDGLVFRAAAPEIARAAEAGLLMGSLLGVLVTVAVIPLIMPSMSDQQLRELFRVTLPKQLAERILTDPGAYHRNERAQATVIFCDISGFTTSVEQLGGDIDAVKQHLEAVMDAVTEVLGRHDLIVDKFIGDAVMAFRGGHLVEGDARDHAHRVVVATLEATDAVEALGDPHFKRVKIGGASSSSALIGAFGTSERLSYTILGDRVNLAARLEAAVKRTGTRNLFCEQTHALLAEDPDLEWRRFGNLKVPGKADPQPAYEAFAAQAAPRAWLPLYERALQAYERGDYPRAVTGFRAATAAREGGDLASERWLEHCEALLQKHAAGVTPPAVPPPFVVSK